MRRLLEKGWQTVYAPEAEILYYRNDNLRELWKRNFDIGVAHAEHPEMIENTKPGKEGMRLVSCDFSASEAESYGGIFR